jgi:TrpR-related protein YerC/YecD
MNNLLCAVVALETVPEARAFLRDLLTAAELREFGARWEAAQLLDRGVSYTTIVSQTGLSSTTIARVSRWLRGSLGGYRSAITKLHHHASAPVRSGLR